MNEKNKNIGQSKFLIMTEVNTITEIFKGHYQVILDFPEPIDLEKIIDKNYRYIWGISHNELGPSWTPYDYSLFGVKLDGMQLQARNIEMEFLIETDKFIELIPFINQTIKIVQTNSIPPAYLDLKRLTGQSRYNLLKDKIEYLFELEMPGAVDYAPIVSSDIEFLKELIKKFANTDKK